MKCDKCNYMYDDNLSACPLCGRPKDENAQTATPPGAGEPAQAAPDYQQTQQPQQETWQYQQPQQQAYRPPYPGQAQPQAQPPQYGIYGQQAQAGPARQADLKQLRGNSTASLVCGILGLFIPVIGIVLSIVALVLGNGAKKKLPEAERGVATAGYVLGIVGLVWNIIIIVFFIVVMAMAFTMAFNFMDPYYGYGGFDSYYWDSILESF